MSILTLAGNLLHYEALGHGEPVIFLHGWIGSWRYWWASMQALSTTRRCLALDLWGFGDSSKSSGHYSLEAYDKLLDHFVQLLGIAHPITIVGHALGSLVALRYAAQRPSKVFRLVIVSLPLYRESINEQLRGGYDHNFAARQFGRDRLHLEISREIVKTDVKAVDATLSEAVIVDPITELVNISCPVLLISGDRDPVIQPGFQANDCASIEGKNVQCISLERCEHFPMLEYPAVFNRLLMDFINNADSKDITPKRYWRRRNR